MKFRQFDKNDKTIKIGRSFIVDWYYGKVRVKITEKYDEYYWRGIVVGFGNNYIGTKQIGNDYYVRDDYIIERIN